MLGEGVLLEELILDDLGGSENRLLIFREGVFTDKLHDFSQLIFGLEDLQGSFTKNHELRVSLGVVLVQDSVIVGETDVPVHTREMLSLGELLVKTPENGYNGKGGRGDWLGHITTGW
jgi:hypothetical protein